ncbi:MAG: large conductance mechanosensitive channel protein MscL [Ruminococcus sp.]|nr:large conductance mechanosensitive channel protein MscL [Ruminococcus sp.]
MKKFFAEFKEFISRGNVLDLAVGVMIGAAFQTIVTALCENIITPLIDLIVGTIAGKSIEEMTSVLKVGPIDFGAFIAAVINFIIMAFIIFLIVKAFNKLSSLKKKKEEKEEEVTTKTCPYCCSEIDIHATRCPHCTSELKK